MNAYIKKTPLIRVGTRGSKLALAQAREFQKHLEMAHDFLREPNSIEIVKIKTTGDRVQDRSLSEIGGKRLFMKEIEEALLEKRIDIALHSVKDVETCLTSGTELTCILPREEINDAFLSNTETKFDELPGASIIGTSSIRRAALIKNKRPDLLIKVFRGNVDTRLAKLDRGEVDATILAVAGLKRLGLSERITQSLSLDEMPPAIGQGAIGAQCRVSPGAFEEQLREWLNTINHEDSCLRITAERAMLARLGGSCQTPIAGFACFQENSKMTLKGYVISPDGSRIHCETESGCRWDGIRLGEVVGEKLLIKAGSDLTG